MDKDIKLTSTQIANMQHCSRKGYFATSSTESWDEVVSYGLATSKEDPFCKGSKVYYLTKEGYDYLSKIS